MRRFLAGVSVGLVVGAAAMAIALWPRRPGDRASSESGTSKAGPAKTGARSAARRARPADTGGDAPPILAPGDEAMAAEGDALRPRARAVDLGAGGDERNFGSSDIDEALRPRSDAILECISSARGAAVLRGRVRFGLVVAPDGRVVQTRVEAPRYLLRRGLSACVRPELSALRFPAAGRDSVVTIPFDLD